MIRTTLTAVALLCLGFGVAAPRSASATDPVLMETYGRGVHAYFAGRYDEAYELLTLAIHNDIQDPRAYYFRGIIAAATGRPAEAESDWQIGADLEATRRPVADIGRSLTRIQGSTRLKLERVRQAARMQAATAAAARSQARYGEIRQAEGRVLKAPPIAVDAPPVPPSAAEDNPFRDDLAGAEPEVQSDDALKGTIEKAEAETQAQSNAADVPGDGGGGSEPDPFGGSPPSDDPFGGGGDDPFGGSGDAGDPFGGDDPFGN